MLEKGMTLWKYIGNYCTERGSCGSGSIFTMKTQNNVRKQVKWDEISTLCVTLLISLKVRNFEQFDMKLHYARTDLLRITVEGCFRSPDHECISKSNSQNNVHRSILLIFLNSM